MRGFFLVMNFIVLQVFIGVPPLGTASASVSGNESLNNPPAGWNSVLQGLGDDVLRRAAENTLNLADRFSPNAPANVGKPGGGLSPGLPTHWQRGGRKGRIPDKHSASPCDLEDDLARFVSQMRAADCCQVWSMQLMQFYSTVTYSPFTFRFPFRSRGRLGKIR